MLSGCPMKDGKKEESLKPVNSGLLYPLSKLKERQVHLKDALQYAVAYHNAFFRDALPVSITHMEITEDNELLLELKQGGGLRSYKEKLSERPTEEVVSGIVRTFVQAVPESLSSGDKRFEEVDFLLASGDEFACIKALKMIEDMLKETTQQSALPTAFVKAGRAYLNLYLVGRRDGVSSFYEDLLSRAYAMDALALAKTGETTDNAPDGFVLNRVLLNYFAGNKKRAYEIALSPAGEKDPLCGFFSALKGQTANMEKADSLYGEFLQLTLTSPDDSERKRKILEGLFANSPDNLFVISRLGGLGVGEAREFTPLLVEKTIQRHLKLINEEYADWLRSVPAGEKLLLHKKTGYEQVKERFRAFVEGYPLFSRLVGRENETVPSYDLIRQVNEILFKGRKYAADVQAALFSGEDERLIFYHDVMASLGQWHYMLANIWGNFDYAMDAAKALNKVFEHDPSIRYFYSRALIIQGKQQEAYKNYWDILQNTGDRELIISILSEREFARFNASLAKDLVEQISRQFPINGTLHNYLGSVSNYIDKELRLKMLREGIMADPWNIDSVYGLSWDSNEFTEMKRLLSELPENAMVNYYAGFLSYYRMGDMQKGITLLRKAAAINPSFVSAVLDLGAILETKGSYNEAIHVYRDYLDVDSESLGAVEVEGRIGNLFLKQGKAREAVEIFSSIAESYKASAMRGAVFSYLAVADFANAELWGKRYVERYPQPNAYTVLCKFYYRTGNYDKLMETIQQYVNRFPQYAAALVNGWQARLSRKDLFEKDFGVMIFKILINGAAEKIGLVEGDIILSYGGKPLNSNDDLQRCQYPLGKKDEVRILRKGSVLTFVLDRGMLGIESEQ
jgi:tetratricopeptide (TPR) repeat protein